MSYGPFIGGKRICLGKTFAEIITKITGSTLSSMLNFEFLDRENNIYKTGYSLFNLSKPVLMVKVSERILY